MRFRIWFALLVGILVVNSGLFAIPLASVLGEAQAKELLVSGKLASSRFRNDAVSRAFPVRHSLLATVDSSLAELKPDLTVEACYFIKRPGKAPENELLALFNVFHRISTLAGIQYWSASRKQWRTFYEKSYIVDGVPKKGRQADPVFPLIPAYETSVVLHTDLTFGENLYRYEYSSENDAFSVKVSNITPLFYGIFQLMDASKMNGFFLIIPCDEGIFLYSMSSAKAFLLPGVEERIEASFGNRADAMFAWFSGRIKEVYPAQ